MSGHDDVPDWAPRTPPETGDPDVPYTFLGASYPGGVPSASGPAGGPRAGGAPGGAAARDPFDAFERPDRPSRPPGPAHAAARPGRKGPCRPPRRIGGILLGPLAGAVALVLVTGAGAYALTSAGDGCSDEDALTISVAAAPDIAPAVVRAAERFNDDRNEIAGRCARALVRPADPAAVATLLSGKGVAGVAEKPDVWIPDSSLWTKLVEGSRRAGAAGDLTGLGGMASTPIVLAMPSGLATRLRDLGAPAQPSWKELLAAAGTAANAEQGPSAPADGAIPPRLFRLRVPDPDGTATGMGTLLLADALLSGDPQGQAGFTGVVRTIREGVAVSVKAGFAAFGQEPGERYPVALAPEQAVFGHNARRPRQSAVAVYPAEGTIYLDHPVTVLSGDPAKLDAGRLLRKELASGATRGDVHRLGFRTPDGAAPAAFSGRTGLSRSAPKAVPPVPAAEVGRTMQQWAQLSLSIRMLSIIDISGSMDRKIAPGATRLQSTIRTAQNGLSLLPDDSELGQWVFSTELEGERDWRELVSVGPLAERLGSATRRQLVLSAFARTRVKEDGGTGLYETAIAAFDHMKRTYKPEYVNSILLWTDGRNQDREGPSLPETLDHIRRAYDPERPVQINMFGIGDGVDVDELRQIARATNGDAYVAQTPGQVQALFLKALSQRVCEPDC
ncbi:substrate-binding domain-containing protein [Actinomadura sp. 7K507]|uniref:substrate-binding domain-containing protein n=1 Tax=Actinomadura sp. 7K507 TaxID=2530365 RepID=UPI001051A253|nr:substrate-binding domain-containing protein [Actinomadura sp. 7K507]TDC89046.1 VWA domain-containing protein [Actinomadura sp. 7K507]